MPPFFDNFRQNVHGNGPGMRPDGGISKNLYVLLQFCVWSRECWVITTFLSQNRDVPPQNVKKVPFWPVQARFFTKNDGASRYWLKTVVKPNYPLYQTQNYNST